MFTTHFYGNKISDYGRERGFVDYATLAKSFDAVLNNNIVQSIGWENWETENGSAYEEIYQYYIISDNGADILKRYTNEIVLYNAELDMYVCGVTHWGTSWDYVLTNIPCEKSE